MSKSRFLAPLLFGAVTAATALLPVTSAFAACSDCHWLYVRCMSRATTPEQAANCEQGYADCQETFCQNPVLGAQRSPVDRKRFVLADATRADTPLPARR